MSPVYPARVLKSAPALAVAAALAACACALAPAEKTQPAPPPACALPKDDREWIERALAAWRLTSREITGITRLPPSRAIFFSADCVLASDGALAVDDAGTGTAEWTTETHSGEIVLPDGKPLPSGVVSFASGEDGRFFFVMSTPSVWEAAGVGEGEDLRRMMVAVMIHEASHVAQIVQYGPRLASLIERHSLPDSFNDDSMQERFSGDEEFAASIRRETDLFLAAAASQDAVEAKRLAREGLGLLRARQARWFTGEDAHFVEAEDIWLTFEGAGQWAAYQWLIHPQGGAADPASVRPSFTGRRWWSQAEGFAVVLAVERIGGTAWKAHAFGDGERTLLQVLEEATRG